MRPGLALVIAIVVGCGSEAASGASSGRTTAAGVGTSTSVPAPRSAGPCDTDDECRLEVAPMCACIALRADAPAGPTLTEACFSYPCMDRVARCHATQHTCIVASTAIPAGPSPDDPF